MNKVFYFLVFLIFIKQEIIAQQIRTLTVSDAVSLALSNAEDIKNLKLDEEIQFQKNAEVVATTRPQISANGQLSYYFSTPQVQFPSSNIGIYQVLAEEGVKDRNGNPIGVDKATFSTQAVSFFAPLNTQFGLGVNQLLFQPDVFVAFKAREEVLNLAKANTAVAIEKAKEGVKKSYYNVIIAEKQKGILAETLKRLQKLTDEMNQMYKQGFAEKLDVEKLQVTINNTQTALNQINNGIAISYTLLKSTIGIPLTDSLVLTESLNTDELKALLIQNESDFSYENRKEIGLLNIAKKLQELDMERVKLGKLPTAAAFINYTRNGQRNSDFNPQDPWFWYNTGITGINVTQPIYDGGQRKRKMEQAKLSLQKVDNNLAQVKRFIDLEKSAAKISINNAVLNLETQERNIKLAESVFETTKKKYAAGVGSSFELIQADTELQRAQGGYFQALYDGYIAKINWDKAIGKL